jgi:hypothetical protein
MKVAKLVTTNIVPKDPIDGSSKVMDELSVKEI